MHAPYSLTAASGDRCAARDLLEHERGSFGELACDGAEEAELGAEALDQRPRGEARLARDLRERELLRPDAHHDPVRRRVDLVVGRLPRTGAHRS